MQWSPVKQEISARKAFDVSWKDLLDKEPFYGAKMFSLIITETTSVDTMATDGKYLYFNPEFTLSLSRQERTFVIRHEVEHYFRLHHIISAEMKKELGESYDHYVMNLAGDYEINQDLQKWGETVCEDALLEERFKGMLLREIYFILKHEQPKQKPQDEPGKPVANEDGQSTESEPGNEGSSGDDNADSRDGDSNGNSQPDPSGNGTENGSQDASDNSDVNNEASGSDSGGNNSGICNRLPKLHGEVLTPENEDGTELSNSQIKELKHEAEKATIAAAKFAEKQGVGNMLAVSDIKDKILTSVEAWEDILSEFFDEKVQAESSWMKPNKRFYSRGMILPSKTTKKVGKLAILDDQSSSVSSRLAALWVDKLNEILSAFDSIEIVRIPFSHYAGECEYYDEMDVPLELEHRFYGGTDFVPPFDALEDSDFMPDAILVLTDMLCSSFPNDPGIPTLWCEACEGYFRREIDSPPFGQVIKIRD